jgi:hypothetical protein
MTCKHCNKEIINKEYGLRDFHPECKKEYRRIYQAQAKRKSRQMKNMTSTSYPVEVNRANPCVSTICDKQNEESETLYNELGGKVWYSFAKRECCNFDVRVKEGYCVTLSEPYQGFSCKCSNCPIGQALMLKEKETKKKKR